MNNEGTTHLRQFANSNEIDREQAKKGGIVRTTPTIDRHYRSLIKAVSWRVTGTFDTIVISYLITGRIRLALSIGFVELFTKVTLYYLHERLWNKLSFGRKPMPGDYQI